MADAKKDTKLQGLFDKFYAAGKDAIDAAKKPLAKRQLKRKCESSIDSCENSILKADLAIQKSLENIEDVDINVWLKHREEKLNAEETKENIKGLYLELFGEEYKTAA